MALEEVIPLFPLSVVLFPYSKLPLYIFEERYKLMIKECMDDNAVFGINFFSENKIHNTGCTASVDEIVNTSATGEMNIVSLGKERYILNDYELNPNGYYDGNIKLLEDDTREFDKEKMKKTVKAYNELVETVYKGTVRKIDLHDIKWLDGKRSVAYLMAEKCGLSLEERQQLLEIGSEDERLDFIINYFGEVIPKMKEADKISTIIKGDGYIQ